MEDLAAVTRLVRSIGFRTCHDQLTKCADYTHESAAVRARRAYRHGTRGGTTGSEVGAAGRSQLP